MRFEINGLITDLRHAIRVYRGTPLASAIAVIALAIAASLGPSRLVRNTAPAPLLREE